MAHSEELKELCKNDYLVFQRSLADISRTRGVALKTLYNWRKGSNPEDDWDLQKAALATTQTGLHGEIYETARFVMRKIRLDLMAGKELDDRIYVLERILKTAMASRAYEKDANPDEQKDSRSASELATDRVRQLRAILGLEV